MAINENTPETQVEHAKTCAFCKRPLPPKKGTGRGRTKEVHKTCSIVRSRMQELERLLSTMEFGDEQAPKTIRGDMFAIVNNTLRKTVVVINPDSDEDI